MSMLLHSTAAVLAQDSRPAPPHIKMSPEPEHRPNALISVAWHSLAWLVFANAAGVLLALLLLFPSINTLMGSWSYGRWMPVHLDLQLYGWCSLPLVGFLMKTYGAHQGPGAVWCRPVLWVWSSALAISAYSWLDGHASGKLFLDFTGYPRVLFPIALLSLWCLLAFAFAHSLKTPPRQALLARYCKTLGLLLLLAIPALIYVASSPDLYPPINPDTGGPTGASQLESTLVIVAVLLSLPFGLTTRRPPVPSAKLSPILLGWALLAVESLLCLGLGRADVSHHRPVQYISLASLLVWLPLTPAYYNAFVWGENTRRWRVAFLCWWSVLVPTGWCLFLPGVLDRFKFTDGLVGHSLLAMAGFVSSLLIFVMVQLLGDDGWIFNNARSFYLWHASVFAYVVLMFYAGWREGADPAFNMVPGTVRDTIYFLRLCLGIFIFLASAAWLLDAARLIRSLRETQRAASMEQPS